LKKEGAAMARVSVRFLSAGLLISLFLVGCKTTQKGRIYFVTNDGTITDKNFSTDYLEGVSGTPIKIELPKVVKTGYYFVGWREKDSQGNYRAITKLVAEDGSDYYYYPYGNDTLYAYFEPETTLTFDLSKALNAAFVSPKKNASDFSSGILSGYVNKTIPSVDYLPTASAEHETFQYWYTQYPLSKVKEAEGNVSYYVLDTTKTLGEYRFDKSFAATDPMSFPSGQVTLYAKWEADPTVTLHFNLDGIEDVTFQARNESLKDKVTAAIESALSTSYTASGLFYPADTKAKKLAGLYYDAAFKYEASLDSPIFDSNLDLYFRWKDAIVVTLDFAGGKAQEVSSVVLDGYYGGDILPESVLTTYKPTKENATFETYTYNGKEFIFDGTLLPDQDVTLLATYRENPTLTLAYQYPSDYAGVKLTDITTKIYPEGASIATALSSFRASLTDPLLEDQGLVMVSADGQEKTATLETMPATDTKIVLKIAEKEKVTLTTYTAADTALAGVEDVVSYAGSRESVSIATLGTDLAKDLTLESTTYVYDGLYSDAALTARVTTLSGKASQTALPTLTLYRKETVGIQLTFLAKADNSLIGTCYVIPGREYVAFKDRIEAVIGTDKTLTLQDGTPLSTLLPQTDTTLLVS
jgi:hypothetical protein